jgi:ETFB lysine methyltransferase
MLRLSRPGSADDLLEAMDPDDPQAEGLIPYWADPWPSAEGLLRFLSSSRGPRRPGSSLEIGAGLGFLGMGILRLGWDLSLSDFHPESLPWLRRNLVANGFSPKRALQLDWRQKPPGRWKSILASDVLYEKSFAAEIADFLEEALLPGGHAWFAEPGRPIAEDGLRLLTQRFKGRIHFSRSRTDGRWKRINILELRRE